MTRQEYFDRKQEYKEYLQSKHWQDLRRKRLIVAGYKCEICGNKDNLHVHHLAYFQLYNVHVSDLQVLCSTCHTKVHSKPVFKKTKQKTKRKKNKKFVSTYKPIKVPDDLMKKIKEEQKRIFK